MKTLLNFLAALFIFLAPAQAAFAAQPAGNQSKTASAPTLVLDKQTRKEMRKELKENLKNIKRNPGASDNTVLKVILAILIPPLAVYLHEGVTTRFWIDLILTLLAITWLIAIIYALIIVLG